MEVGIFMAKYSFELKKKVVEEYLRGEGGKRVHAQKHNIQTPKLIIQWVKNYSAYGDKGLLHSR